MESIKCKNCNNEFTGNYCNNCSQASNVERINLKFILSEVQKTFIHFDSGFLYTTKKLFINPGSSILSYLNGARINHFRPFSYIFFIVAAYLILINSSHLTILKGSVENASNNEVEILIKENFISIQFVFIFIYSLLSLLIFHYRHLNLYEFIVLHTFLAGQRILINIVLMPFLVWDKTDSYSTYFNLIGLLLGNIYMIATYVKIFSHKNTFVVILKTVLLQFILMSILYFILHATLK